MYVICRDSKLFEIRSELQQSTNSSLQGKTITFLLPVLQKEKGVNIDVLLNEIQEKSKEVYVNLKQKLRKMGI